MEHIKILKGDRLQESHVLQALSLDYLVYPKEYHLTSDDCLDYFHKNPYIYFMAADTKTNKIVGYINFSPLDTSCYTVLKSGKAIDTIVSGKDILVYEPHKHYHGYFSSIVVHPDYRHKGIAKQLLEDLFNYLYYLAKEQDIWFDEITADIISPEGARLAPKFGFVSMSNSSHDSTLMLLNPRSPGERLTQKNMPFFRLYMSIGA